MYALGVLFERVSPVLISLCFRDSIAVGRRGFRFWLGRSRKGSLRFAAVYSSVKPRLPVFCFRNCHLLLVHARRFYRAYHMPISSSNFAGRVCTILFFHLHHPDYVCRGECARHSSYKHVYRLDYVVYVRPLRNVWQSAYIRGSSPDFPLGCGSCGGCVACCCLLLGSSPRPKMWDLLDLLDDIL